MMKRISHVYSKQARIVFLFFVEILVLTIPSYAQSSHQMRRDADKAYTKGEYNEAEEKYRRSLQKDPGVKGHFNLGNSLFQQQRYEEALEQYDKAIAESNDPKVQSNAYYNKGNALFSDQKLEESLEAYKQALRLNPENAGARQNLFLTRQMIRQQQQQQQQQQNNQDQQNQNQEKQQEGQKDPEEKDQQEQQEKEEKDQDQNEQKEKDQQQQEPGQIDSTAVDSLINQQINREELMKLLKAIEDEDKNIQQKLRRGSSQKKKSDKDW